MTKYILTSLIAASLTLAAPSGALAKGGKADAKSFGVHRHHHHHHHRHHHHHHHLKVAVRVN